MEVLICRDGEVLSSGCVIAYIITDHVTVFDLKQTDGFIMSTSKYFSDVAFLLSEYFTQYYTDVIA